MIDLHTHSTHSDGTLTPTQLVRLAADLGVTALALCDHNPVTGLPELMAAAREYGVEGVPGVEFSTEYRGVELHILGLFIRPERYDEVKALLRQMLREHEQLDQFSNDMIIAQLNMVLLELMREAAAPSNAKLQTSNAIHSENEIIRKAQQYISSHIREKLSVPLVARQVDVSPSYLTALFHKNLQISPGEYIRRIKLQESKQMIRENDLNFTEIAATLQYSTVHHFSRQFKEKFGITPTEYAKSVR